MKRKDMAARLARGRVRESNAIAAEPDPIKRWAKTHIDDDEHIFDCFEQSGIRQAIYILTDKHVRFLTEASKNGRKVAKKYMIHYRTYSDCVLNPIRTVGDAELAAVRDAIK